MSKTIKKYTNFDWIDLEKPERNELETLAHPFSIDINLLEDILEHGHLPKIEKVSGDYTFIILRAHSANYTDNVTSVGELSNKIAFFINPQGLITVHRASFDFLKNLAGEFADSEKLMLAIMDEMLNTYEGPLHFQSEKMDEFEREIFLKNGTSISIESLYYQRSKARVSKKVLQLTQNVLNQICVNPDSQSFLQDLKETTLRMVLNYEEVIEDANTILNTYLSLTAKKSNDVMKLLTVFSAFFLPLTFIVGIYGMNFDIMPELRWDYGYYFALGGMLLISVIIFIWFKRKRIM
ncbi:MAG: CorA family divalent cation transporter [Bacteroidota bacterium]